LTTHIKAHGDSTGVLTERLNQLNKKTQQARVELTEYQTIMKSFTERLNPSADKLKAMGDQVTILTARFNGLSLAEVEAEFSKFGISAEQQQKVLKNLGLFVSETDKEFIKWRKSLTKTPEEITAIDRRLEHLIGSLSGSEISADKFKSELRSLGLESEKVDAILEGLNLKLSDQDQALKDVLGPLKQTIAEQEAFIRGGDRAVNILNSERQAADSMGISLEELRNKYPGIAGDAGKAYDKISDNARAIKSLEDIDNFTKQVGDTFANKLFDSGSLSEAASSVLDLVKNTLKDILAQIVSSKIKESFLKLFNISGIKIPGLDASKLLGSPSGGFDMSKILNIKSLSGAAGKIKGLFSGGGIAKAGWGQAALAIGAIASALGIGKGRSKSEVLIDEFANLRKNGVEGSEIGNTGVDFESFTNGTNGFGAYFSGENATAISNYAKQLGFAVVQHEDMVRVLGKTEDETRDMIKAFQDSTKGISSFEKTTNSSLSSISDDVTKTTEVWKGKWTETFGGTVEGMSEQFSKIDNIFDTMLVDPSLSAGDRAAVAISRAMGRSIDSVQGFAQDAELNLESLGQKFTNLSDGEIRSFFDSLDENGESVFQRLAKFADDAVGNINESLTNVEDLQIRTYPVKYLSPANQSLQDEAAFEVAARRNQSSAAPTVVQTTDRELITEMRETILALKENTESSNRVAAIKQSSTLGV